MTVRSDKDFLEIFLVLAGIFCLVCVGFCALIGAELLIAGKQESTATDQHLNRVLIVAGATLTNIEKASRSTTAREDAELKQLNAVMGGLQITVAKVNVTVDSLNALVVHSDTRMGTLADNANTAIKDLHPVLLNLNAAVGSTKTTLDSLNQTVIAANKLVSDPTIPKTLTNIQASTASIASSTQQLDTSLRVDVLPYVHRLTKPAKAVWAVLKEVGRDLSAAGGGYFGTHGF